MTSDAPPVCYRHPGRSTRISCSECGRPICPDCTHDAAVGQKCPECAAPQHRTTVIAARDTWGVGMRTTPVTLGLIVVNVAIFFVGLSSPEADSWLFRNLALIKSVAPDEWWRVITSAFLHGSFLHVGINMYVLYLLGPQLERQTGSPTFAMLYLAGAAAGGAVSVIGSTATSIGASGAVFALLGAWFSASYRHRDTPAGRAMFNQMLFWLVLSAVTPVLLPRIDWRAHVGGVLAGVLIHQLWTRLAADRANAKQIRIVIAAAVLGLALAVTGFQ